MKRKLLIVVAIGFTVMLACAPALAQRYGLADREGVWRDAAYWHENHPEWVYRYHPEWVVDQQDWWVYDHQRHPEWFGYPFWREHPIWTYGAYDQYHHWRYAGWWREHNAGWFYANHPRWAEPYPNWIRADHYAHPDWFRSPYWHDHPHDWNHPDEAYRELRRTDYREPGRAENRAYPHGESQYSHPAAQYSHGNSNYHPNHENNYHSNDANNYHSNMNSGGAYHAGGQNFPSAHSARAASHPSGGGGGGGHEGHRK